VFVVVLRVSPTDTAQSDHFELDSTHLHVCQPEVIDILFDDLLQVRNDVLVLCREKSSDQVVHGILLSCKYNVGDCLHNGVLQHVILKTKALTIEETCDFLCTQEKVL